MPGSRELYVVDLASRTLERVAHSFAGGDVDAGVLEGATISDEGERVAFASFAGDLFFGDANQRADAFVATRQPDPGAAPPDEGLGKGGPAGTIVVDREGPQIGVRAQSKAGGAILLSVSAPAAGGLKAVAKARAGAPRKPRVLGTVTGRAGGTARSTVRLLLRPVARYRGELRERGAIPGRVSVGYVASRGGRRASASVRVVFRQQQEGSKKRRQRPHK